MLTDMNTLADNKNDDLFMGLSQDQWSFLAVIDAFGEAVSIDTAGILFPLLPGPLINLLKTAESNGWIDRTKDERLSISKRLPVKARTKLDAINSREQLSDLIDRIENEKLSTRINKKILARIMCRAGRIMEAGKLETELAKEAFENKNNQEWYRHLGLAVSAMAPDCNAPEIGDLFIRATLQWSNASFALGKNPLEVEPYLHKALDKAEILGDIRSRALLNFHLGRIYYFTDRRDEALVALSIGSNEIEELDDADIQAQSAVFMGLYFFIIGEHESAYKHLEKANQQIELVQDPALRDPMGPVYFGYCATYLGKFHQAIGALDYYIRLSRKQSDLVAASTLRTALGTALTLVRKDKEARIHLKRAEKEAKQTGNAFGLYLNGGCVALGLFLKGNTKKAYDVLAETFEKGRKAGFIHQFSSPWIVEMLHEFNQLGYPPIKGFEFTKVVDRIMDGVNIHLQGVCLRMKAKTLFGQSGAHMKIADYLTESEEKLRKSGDPIQTSKTLLEIARLKQILGHRDKAKKIAREARQILGGYVEEFFPDEFSHLVDDEGVFPDQEFDDEAFFDKYLAMFESLYPSQNRMEILLKMFSATCQMFGAERGGLFWFTRGEYTKKPELRASLNLPRTEITSTNFKPSMELILKAYKEKKPLSTEIVLKEFNLNKKFVRSVLLVPLEVKGRVHGVVYYDNSYLDNAFDFLNLSLIKQMARLTNMVVEQSIDQIQVKDQATRLASEKRLLLDSKKGKIITQSKDMLRLLERISRVAETESTILILGETGTGKELVAKYIHGKSHRNNGPFIILDSTTIPEKLLESELFGHEKGSFTGADKRKVGCIEMADKGTLFLDEVGELPLPAQAKLLRTLQEKTIRRVGGASHITSDFRLVAATNRDLAIEVKEGRFREDLFYRLNVVPFELPPLKDRGNDPILLSQYFIERYTKKYHIGTIELSPKDRNDIMNYPWPGNIRELKNVMERAVLLSDGKELEINLQISQSNATDDFVSDMPTLNELQRRYITHVLSYTRGKVSGPGGACEILGLKRPTFYSKMRSLGIRKNKRL